MSSEIVSVSVAERLAQWHKWISKNVRDESNPNSYARRTFDFETETEPFRNFQRYAVCPTYELLTSIRWRVDSSAAATLIPNAIANVKITINLKWKSKQTVENGRQKYMPWN